MTDFLDWKYIDEKTTCSLEEICDEMEVKQLLREVFRVGSYPENKQEILIDFHFQTYAFCKSAAFNARQISTLMSIMNEIFLIDASANSLKNSASTSFERFQGLILKHSVERPPKSVQIFQPSDVEPILNFALERYYRHFSLYSYVFGTRTILTIRQVGGGGVELPLVPMALQRGRAVPVPVQPSSE